MLSKLSVVVILPPYQLENELESDAVGPNAILYNKINFFTTYSTYPPTLVLLIVYASAPLPIFSPNS